MATLADARIAIVTALNKIAVQQDDPATTPEAMAVLAKAVDDLLQTQKQIEMAQLDEAASAVEAAATALQAVIDDARLDTLSQLKQQLGALQTQLDGHHAEMFSATKMAKATDPTHTSPSPSPGAAEPRAATPGAANGAASSGGVPINSTRFDDLRAEYEQLYATCVTVPGKESIVRAQVTKLLTGRDRYAGVAADTPEMPWYLVGIIHGMEAGYRFAGHLHNGDPLAARTVNVPAGRPPLDHPPFTWEESARDALQFDGLTGQTDFSIPRLLYFFEKYNGFGYRSHGVPSPYLWGYSSHYKGGKFIADHLFSKTAFSDQVGAAVLLKTLERQGAAT